MAQDRVLATYLIETPHSLEHAAAVMAGEQVSLGLELGEVQELGQPGRPGFKFVFFNDPDGNGWAVQEIPR